MINNKVQWVIIKHKDRLSRFGFDFFKHLFAHYRTEIIVMSDILDPKTDEQEIMSKMMTLFHCFAMKSYVFQCNLRSKM